MTAKMKQPNPEISIHCGKNSDDFEHLKILCHKEIDKLPKDIDISTTIVFWTKDIIPELIGTGRFYKDGSGTIRYELDFSQTTL